MAASPRDSHVLYTMLVLGGDMRFIFGGDGRSIKSAFGRVKSKISFGSSKVLTLVRLQDYGQAKPLPLLD